MTDPIERLRQARRLDSPEAVEAFEQALNDLPDDLDPRTLDALHLVLLDDTDDPGVMFDLIHRVERTRTGEQEASLLRVVSRLDDSAPEWAETVTMRLLNNTQARSTLARLAKEAPGDQRSALRVVLERIAMESDAVGLAARSVLDDL